MAMPSRKTGAQATRGTHLVRLLVQGPVWCTNDLTRCDAGFVNKLMLHACKDEEVKKRAKK